MEFYLVYFRNNLCWIVLQCVSVDDNLSVSVVSHASSDSVIFVLTVLFKD